MIKKVYVLVNEWTIDGGFNEDSGIEISVFDTLSYAQENMFNSAECWCFENQTDEWERIEGNDSMSIECYIEGSYIDNHIRWFIEEKEIEQDPEQLND
jgi:hypothetical protein